MRNLEVTPAVETVTEIEVEKLEDGKLEPQSRAEASHGRNIERISLFNVGHRQFKFSSKNANKSKSVPKNPEILNS